MLASKFQTGDWLRLLPLRIFLVSLGLAVSAYGTVAAEQTLIIESVKCIKTSDILEDSTLVGAMGVLAAAGFIVLTDGAGAITLTQLGSAGATSAGAKQFIEELARDFGGSPDDLYIKVGDDKIWPSTSSRSIVSQQEFDVDYEATFDNETGVVISLWEEDPLSDDALGSYLVRDVSAPMQDTAIVFGKDMDGVYQIRFRVE